MKTGFSTWLTAVRTRLDHSQQAQAETEQDGAVNSWLTLPLKFNTRSAWNESLFLWSRPISSMAYLSRLRYCIYLWVSFYGKPYISLVSCRCYYMTNAHSHLSYTPMSTHIFTFSVFKEATGIPMIFLSSEYVLFQRSSSGFPIEEDHQSPEYRQINPTLSWNFAYL